MPKGQAHVFLHPLPDDVDLLRAVSFEGSGDEMPIISTEVVEKDGDFVGLPSPQIAFAMQGSNVEARDVIVITNLSVEGGVDDLPTGVADGGLFELALLLFGDDDAPLIEQERDGLLSKDSHLLEEIVDAILANSALEPPLVLWNGADNLPPNRARGLKLVVIGFVTASGMGVPCWFGESLEIGVHHEGDSVNEGFIGKFHLPPLFGSDENLARALHPATPELVSGKGMLELEMTQTSLAPKNIVLLCKISHEAVEGFYPRIMLIPVEQVDALVERLLGDVHWETSPSLVIEEGEDIDVFADLIFDVGDLVDCYWVLDLIEMVAGETGIVLFWAIRMLPTIHLLQGGYNGVAEAAIVFIFNVDNRLLVFQEFGQLLIAMGGQGIVFAHFEAEVEDVFHYQTRTLSDEVAILREYGTIDFIQLLLDDRGVDQGFGA